MTLWIKHPDVWPAKFTALVCICLVLVVGLVDYATGYETFFFVFYLLAVFLGTWRLGAPFGILISALSVTAWISTNIAAGERYSSYFVPVWNALIMFTFYVIVVVLLALLKKLRAELEARVSLRTAALTREIQERMRLQKELLETSEREQRRIGRDLHDGLCQHLTGTALAGHLLGQKLTDQSLAEAAEAVRLVELIEAAIELTRNLSQQLDPVDFKAGKLTDYFAELAATTGERSKVACHFECSLAIPLDDADVATQLFRIAQEAVANAVRHARAAHINICLDSADDEIVLTVTDDGAGLPENIPDGGGMGLRTMAYRADLIGATFNLERLSTHGTRVTCALPAAGLLNQKNAAKN